MSWSESNAISKGKFGVKLLEKFGREIKKKRNIFQYYLFISDWFGFFSHVYILQHTHTLL